MADKNARRRCFKEFLKCDNNPLSDFNLPPRNLPYNVFEENTSSQLSIGSELKRRVHCCMNSQRPVHKVPPLSQFQFLSLKPQERWSDFSMGANTLSVPMSLFSDNRKRLCDALRNDKNLPPNAIVFLEGGSAVPFHNTDIEYLFRQEPYFHWCFGVTEPDFYGAIAVSTGRSVLFIPKLPDSYATWLGPLKSLCDFKKKYEVDDVQYTDQIKSVLQNLAGTKPVLLIMEITRTTREPKLDLTQRILFTRGKNTDSGLPTKEIELDAIKEFPKNHTLLYPAITELRVFKTKKELEVLRYTNKISSEAHKQVMRRIRPGMKEYQCESIFLDYCYYTGGARHVSYTCICGTGENAAILHYGHAAAPNDKKINDGEICCFDMGCTYYGYASDITCSYPVNGKFTEDQKLIYNAVLAANRKIFQTAKPGVSWVDMHRLANETILECLKKGGLLQGDVKEMMEADLGAVFQPHGLGHLMGCDVHDVGGYMDHTPPRPTAPGFDRLRTARVLQPGMVITVEPGCYFVGWLLDRAMENPKQRKFLVPKVLERFRNFGGIRIEDDALVTENGMENLTNVPRTVEEIERWMAKSDYTEAVDNLIYGKNE